MRPSIGLTWQDTQIERNTLAILDKIDMEPMFGAPRLFNQGVLVRARLNKIVLQRGAGENCFVTWGSTYVVSLAV